ncbi:MAG TPA: N-acetyltransferase [Candidatus Methylomirabilis sp.]|nr:N-acetyltransferase [Candidatus Methylomirabilis sp.]
MLVVRPERPEEHAPIRQVNTLAFGRPNEAALVDALRQSARPYLSLVAVEDGRIVGHIFFSPVIIQSETGTFPIFGLAPMAVLPECQRRGIGSQLVLRGLEACARIGQTVVVVLGHPAFYPRFGFVPASRKGLYCEYAVPDEAFMVLELLPGVLQGRTGVVKYLPEFAGV